jgi:hypothetical protein
MTPYPDQLASLTAADPALGAEVAALRNLEGILRWAPAAGIPLADLDLVQQDEYSYDLLLPLPTGARPSRPHTGDDAGETPAIQGGRWIVFGVT